jgi:hypothetical protein
MDKLYLPQTGVWKSMWSNTRLPPHEEVDIAVIDGPAVIHRFKMTFGKEIPGDDFIFTVKGWILRIYWDDFPAPSVTAPIGDFFGLGFGVDSRLSSLPITRDGNGGHVMYFPMPFRRKARITIENVSDRPFNFYYPHIEYQSGASLPEEIEYFHAEFRQSCPVGKYQTHTVLDTKGRGKFVGLFWNVHWLNVGNPPENYVSFWVDGDLCGGDMTEDYFGQAWGFRLDALNFPYTGQSLTYETSEIGTGRLGAYRFHVPDPVTFSKSLKMTINDHDCRGGYRTDIFETTAFWYQREPAATMLRCKRIEDLVPLTYAGKSFANGLWQIYQHEKAGRIRDAIDSCESLERAFPCNAKVPDVVFKKGVLLEQLADLDGAMAEYQRVLHQWPESDAAVDAKDKLWLFEKPGRVLLTVVTPAGWEAFWDGQELRLDSELLKTIPENADTHFGEWPYFGKWPACQKVAWHDSSSSIMRFPNLRIEAGQGEHLLAIKALATVDQPLKVRKQGYLICLVDTIGPNSISTDATWKMSSREEAQWFQPSFADTQWRMAVVHHHEEYQDAGWYWLCPKAMRKLPGTICRIWDEGIDPRKGFHDTLYFRKKVDLR